MKTNLIRAAFSMFMLIILATSAYSQWLPTNWTESNYYYDLTTNDGVVFARVWDSNIGGRVFFSDDNGANWAQISSADEDLDILSIVTWDNKILAGTWEGLYQCTLNDITWGYFAPEGLPMDTPIWSLSIIDNALLAGTIGDIYLSSTDDENTWAQISTGIVGEPRIKSIVANGNAIFAGSDNDGVFISTDDGASWAKVNAGLADTHISKLISIGTKMFAITLKKGVLVADSGGMDWGNIQWQAYNADIDNINCLLASSGLLFAGTDSNGVYLSDDDGQTWLPVNSGLPEESKIWSMVECGDYIFAGTDDGVWQINPLDINNFTISASTTEGGTISPEGDILIYEGDSQTFTITPSLGYSITDVLVDGESVGVVESYTFMDVNANHTISAILTSVSIHTITASAEEGGKITPSGDIEVSEGAPQAFTIEPFPGYAIADVTVDGNSVGKVSTYTFNNVTENHTISVAFEPAPYTITVSAGTGGTISPSGVVEVWGGGSQTFTITPSAQYEIANVVVDGVSVGAVKTYTFSNITTNHTISATFSSMIIYQINCGGGMVSPYATDQFYNTGSVYSVTDPIDTSGVTNPAPESVYQTERYGTMAYTLPNLQSGKLYKVRLHFAELYHSSTGARRFNVTINGVTLLWNYDVYAETGASRKATVVEYTTLPNSSGQIVINFTTVTDNAKISAIELIKQ